MSLRAFSVFAHAGEAHDALEPLWTRWTADPLVIAMLVTSSTLYALGATRLWRRAGRGRGLRFHEVASFVLGLLSVVIALLSPIDALSEVLFSAHMGQHEILMLISAPLIVFGRPLYVFLWAFGDRRRERLARWSQRPGVRAVWRRVTHPLGIVVAHALAVWVWHLPALYEAALASEAVHVVQHACFFVTAALFWWTMVYGRYGRIGYGVAVLYVFLTAAHSGALGALATFAQQVWYPTYAERAQALSTSALEDQQLAGLLMWVPAGAVLTILGLALFAAWLGEASRRVSLGRADALGRREVER